MTVRLMIVDDHPVVRQGICAMLEANGSLNLGSELGIAVVAQAENGKQALRLLESHEPEVVLLDIRMPDMDGMACLKQIRTQRPQTAVLLFTGYENSTYAARASALGAQGYLSKSISGKALIEAIRNAAKGESCWSKEELRKISGVISPSLLEELIDTPLTKREAQVLKQLAFGLTNKEIAEALGISYETVKEHVQHVLRKLGVSDRTQAAVWAVRQGLV